MRIMTFTPASVIVVSERDNRLEVEPIPVVVLRENGVRARRAEEVGVSARETHVLGCLVLRGQVELSTDESLAVRGPCDRVCRHVVPTSVSKDIVSRRP